jgi:hypothetical protein
MVGVSVSRNYSAYVRRFADVQAWQVEYPQRSAVRCGVLPADA